MYHYLEDYSKVLPYHEFFSNKLNQLKQRFEKDYKIQVSINTVGSYYRDLITQNGNLPFDIDYNIVLENRTVTDVNAGPLKNYAIKVLNELIGDRYSDFKYCQDSTAAITIRHVVNAKLEFSADIAIVASNKNGLFCRLIHDKKNNKYDWSPIPNSDKVYDRFRKLKQYGYMNSIKERYLDKKNFYLRKQDHSHPSFVVFVEAVNEIWNKACSN